MVRYDGGSLPGLQMAVFFPCHHREGEIISLVSALSCEATNLILESSLSHNLITPQNSHHQIPLPWTVELQHMNLGGHTYFKALIVLIQAASPVHLSNISSGVTVGFESGLSDFLASYMASLLFHFLTRILRIFIEPSS